MAYSDFTIEEVELKFNIHKPKLFCPLLPLSPPVPSFPSTDQWIAVAVYETGRTDDYNRTR
jgi:hypothetical protein